MSHLVLAPLERLPARVRRFVVAIGALLALGAVIAALTLTTPLGGQKRQPAPQHPAPTLTATHACAVTRKTRCPSGKGTIGR